MVGSRLDEKIKIWLFIFLVVLAGLSSLALLFPLDHSRDPYTVSFLLILAAVTGVRPIRIPAIRTEVSASDPFVFTAIAYVGGLPAVGASVLAVLGAAVIRRPAPRPEKLLFNLGAVLLATSSAAATFLNTGGVVGGKSLQQVGPLVCAATVYFVVNTLLVAMVIKVDSGEPFFKTWMRSGLWTSLSTYTGLTLAVGLLLLLEWVGPVGLALGIPPCWLLVTFYRTHKERLESQQQKIVQVEHDKIGLEKEVQERTQALQDALNSLGDVNQRLKNTNVRLEKAGRAKSEFLANMSHELRTPLNAIIGFSDLLKEGEPGPVNEEQLDFLNDINVSGIHLLQMINDILDLSKIEAGKLEVRRTEFELDEALQASSSMLRIQAEQKGLVLNINSTDDGLIASLDSGMVRQILINVLSNAVKFTPMGGKITLTASARDKNLVLRISDTGVGIPEEDLSKIFLEFYQVDGTYTRKHQGTGLGLALVRRMVELHEGTIEVESRVGEGTTFTLVFPNCVVGRREARPAESSGLGAKEPSFDGVTVMVVEDEPINMKLARNVLKRRGFGVLEANSGAAARAILRMVIPDLILMDIDLGGESGLDITRSLKSSPRTADIPVVALTAYASEADKQNARDAGCAGYITKPIRLNRLVSSLAVLLKKSSGEDPVEWAV